MTVRDEFKTAIWSGVEECRNIGHPTIRFVQMINKEHPVEVCKRLIKSGELQDGLTSIVKKGRPELSIEHIMLQKQFRSLFTPDELQAAKWRLDEAKKKYL